MLLFWVVITKSIAAYLASADPESALRLQSDNPTALLGLSASGLRQQRTVSSEGQSDPPSSTNQKDATATQEPAGAASDSVISPGAAPISTSNISAWTERALLSDPLNARAFSILGQMSQDEAKTEAFMRAAIRRSLHQRAAVFWMMQSSYQKGNFSDTLRYADISLRTRPQTIQHVIPILGKIAELDEAKDELKELLATDPPWRSAFFARLPSAITDARTPLNLLFALTDTSSPPTADDVSGYIRFLIGHEFYDLAYYVWLRFLPPAQMNSAGHLFNGNFETASSGLPFDWTFDETTGAAVKIKRRRADAPGEHAMFIEFGPGRVHFRGVRQMILLEPGRYEFQGRYNGDILSERGLKWVIRCTTGELIGVSELVKGTSPEWQRFGFSFSVPEQDCPAQYAELIFDARSESERFISGTVWYDELQISRKAHSTHELLENAVGETNGR